MNEPVTPHDDAAAQTLLGVWAHPDDEAYLSAGLMGRTRDAGGRVVCVHATFGELGTDEPDVWPPARLAARRRSELAASLAVVGVTESIEFGYADGSLAEVPREEPVERLIEIVREVRPTTIVTFGPDGMTGHPDHLAVSSWTTAAWAAACPDAELLYATTTAEFAERHAAMYDELRLVSAPGLPLRTPASAVALDVALTRSELDRKRIALAAHSSQTSALARRMGESRFRHWFDHETFRRPTTEDVRVALDRRRTA